MRAARGLLLVALAAAALGASAPASAAASAPDIRPRVVGGAPADIATMPWMVYLEASSSQSAGWACGGTVVAEHVVLTAAHCVVDAHRVVAASRIRGVVGRAALADRTTGLEFAVTSVAVHPGYDRRRAIEGGPYDAALLLTDVALTPAATALPLATTADAAAYAAGAVAQIAGWGLTAAGGGSGSGVLMTAAVPIVSDATCATQDGITLAEARLMVCAGYEAGGIDTCQGDSGGPLTVVADGSPIAAGVVSWGFECAAARHPGVYTRVALIEPWATPLLGGDPDAWATAADHRAPRVTAFRVRARHGVARFRYRIAGETGPTVETISVRRSPRGRVLRTMRTVAAVNRGTSVVRWRVPRSIAAGTYTWCVTSQDVNANVSATRCKRLVVAR